MLAVKDDPSNIPEHAPPVVKPVVPGQEGAAIDHKLVVAGDLNLPAGASVGHNGPVAGLGGVWGLHHRVASDT